jgi:hypothetical protein
MGSKRQHGTKCNRASQHNAIDNCEFVWKVHISRHIIVSLNPPMLGTVMHLGGHNAKHALHPLGTDIITQSGPGPLALPPPPLAPLKLPRFLVGHIGWEGCCVTYFHRQSTLLIISIWTSGNCVIFTTALTPR